MMKNTFTDQVIIVTGASSGIGQAISFQLGAQKARLILAARNQDRLEATAEKCRALGSEALVCPTDVSEQSQCEYLIRTTVETYGRINMLVSNAGVSQWAFFEEITDLSLFEKLIRVNYLSHMYLTNYALPHLKKTNGRVVAVSSLAGLTGVPSRTGYSASKHAMVGFFDALRTEIDGSGVTITLIYPGFVTSEMRLRAFGPDGKPLGYSPVKESEVMSAEECARLILNAAEKRKREEVMTLRGKAGRWIKLIAPGLVDRMARKAIKEGK
jgi:short-subunit dehydrogenase